MSQPSKRARRVADLVRREVANCLQREIRDPRIQGVSITEVEMAPDMKSARVYYSVLDESQLSEVEQALQKADRYMRHYLAQHTELRYTPKLVFKYDDTMRRAERLSRLLEDTRSYEQEDSDEEETS